MQISIKRRARGNLRQVRKSDVLTFFFFALMLYPPGLRNLKIVIYTILTYVNVALFVIAFCYNFRHLKRSGWLYGLVAVLGYCFVIELIKSPGDLLNFVRSVFVPALEGVMLFVWMPKREDNSGIKPLMLLCKILLIGNFLSAILFPNGMFISTVGSSRERAQWLLGSKNNISIYVAFCLAIIYTGIYFDHLKGKRSMKKFIAYSVAAVYPAFMCGETGIEFMSGSSSAMVAVIVLILGGFYFIFIQNRKSKILNFLINPTVLITIVILANSALIFGTATNWATEITSLVGKNATFSGRTYVWQSALLNIARSPWFGYGEQQLELSLESNGTMTTYVYNFMLKMAQSYGVIGLGLIMLLIYRFPRIKYNNVQSSLIMLGVVAVLTVGMMNEVSLFFITSFAGCMMYYQRMNEINTARRL